MSNNVHRKPKGKRTFLTVPDAADYIHRHRATLDKWRSENIVLPYYKDGRNVLYDVADLDAYLESKRVEPVAYGRAEATQTEEFAA